MKTEQFIQILIVPVADGAEADGDVLFGEFVQRRFQLINLLEIRRFTFGEPITGGNGRFSYD